jgi:NADPH:quinone reductase-like Zn-dependent oxidoreductase
MSRQRVSIDPTIREQIMRAIVQDRYGAADVLELRDIEKPEVGDDDVLVRVCAAGVDQGVWHLMAGLPYLVRIMGFGFRTPKNPVRGEDLAGRVEAAGRNVTQFEPGDEVFGAGHGTFAEFALAKESHLVRKPPSLAFEQAAAVPTSALTALQGLRDHGGVQAGQRVVVVGAAGGVGSFAVQIAKALGAQVTGVCSTGKVETVRSLGADHVIDYTREDFTASGGRWDVILDIAGNRPLSRLRRALTPKGTLVLVGGEKGDRWIGGMHRQIGAVTLSPFVSQNLRMFIATVRREDLEFLAELIEGGRLTPLVDRSFPLAQVPDAIRYLREGRVQGKVVITV